MLKTKLHERDRQTDRQTDIELELENHVTRIVAV